MTPGDLELLRDFAQNNSQAAFAQLVRRHVNLVYSAALRQVRSPQLAEEATQSVFFDLAQDAGKLKPDTILAAWLYQVTRRTAIDVVRQESRRQGRERIAAEMAAMNTATEWNQIGPLLDEAMNSLDATERAAVLLRYFENRSLREVGAALGASDDAAQKRVSRAVDRLREFFAKRGVSIGAGGLAAAISANSVQAAPAGLVATISTAVITGTSVVASVTATTKTIAMTTLQKTLVTTAIAAAVGTGIYEARQVSQSREQLRLLQQERSEQINRLAGERDEALARLAAAQAEANLLKSNAVELTALRAEVKSLRAQSRESVSVPAGSGQTPAAPVAAREMPANRELPKDAWGDAGFTNIEAALKTRGWAVLNGNRERFAESVFITPEARKFIEDQIVQMASASTDPDRDRMIQEALKNKWGAEEAILMPMMALNQKNGFDGYGILSQEMLPDGDVMLQVETQSASAPPQTETLRFRRFGNDWKVVIDENAVKTAK